MLAILSFIVVLSSLVIIHEVGHFVTAKLCGVEVKEFAIGFPPRLFTVRRGETDYSINALPLGGYVKMAGEDDPSSPRNLAGKPRRIRAIILGAGAFNNILLAILLFAIVGMVPKQVDAGDIQIVSVFPNSPAAAAGVQPGDIVRRVNGQPIENAGDIGYQLSLRTGALAKMDLERAGEPVQIYVTPRWQPPADQGATGIKFAIINPHVITRSDPFPWALWKGAQRTVETVVLIRNEVTKWFIGSAPPQFTGPIGVAQLTGEVASLGVLPLLELAALLSLNLGIMNILPFPALDGGRLLFVGIEALRGKPISPKREALVHMAGFVVLIAGMLIISYFDIVRITHGGNLLGN